MVGLVSEAREVESRGFGVVSAMVSSLFQDQCMRRRAE
jgi:hypothetical protein